MTYRDPLACSRTPRGLVGRILAGLRRRHETAAARQRLIGLDPHLLRDIGIDRARIEELLHDGR